MWVARNPRHGVEVEELLLVLAVVPLHALVSVRSPPTVLGVSDRHQATRVFVIVNEGGVSCFPDQPAAPAVLSGW